jgi:hypothetical protein
MRPPMHRRRVAQAAMLLLGALLLGGCEQMERAKQVMGEMTELRNGIAREFGAAPNISITNGRVLTLTFVNSGFEKLPPERREATARRIAEHVRDHYAGYARLSQVNVAFSSQRKVGPVTTGETQPRHVYSTSELGAPPAPGS